MLLYVSQTSSHHISQRPSSCPLMNGNDPEMTGGACPTILVVAHAQTEAPVLCPEGMVILHAATAPAALDLLELHDLAVVILDLRQPTSEGERMADLICRSPACSELPIIVLEGGHVVPWDALSQDRPGLLDVLHAGAPAAHLQSKLRFFLELHRQRRWLGERAQSLERYRDHLISTLTHDMRTPLASILLCAEKLSFDLRSNVHVRRTLGHLHTSADGLVRALEKLPPTTSVKDSSVQTGRIDSAPTPSSGPRGSKAPGGAYCRVTGPKRCHRGRKRQRR